MKKIFTAVCIGSMALLSMSSCCGKGSSCDVNENDNFVSAAVNDSISKAQGTYIGNAVLSNFPMAQKQENISKEEVVKGIQLVFGAVENRGTEVGVQFGLQMLNEMRQLEGLGIKVDHSTMLNAFKKAFLQDTISQEDAERSYTYYQSLINKVQEEAQAREDARIAASPEALKNVADGKAYIDSVRNADPEFKVTDDGLVYKIENAGNGTPVKDSKRLKLKYTESKIDGSEVVKTSDEGRTTYLSTVNKGFAEGLEMLSKGGKAVFYVPGEIAYGVKGVPSRNVGPNETIVYVVEVLEVE